MIEFIEGEMYYSLIELAEYAEEMNLSPAGFAALLTLVDLIEPDTRMLKFTDGTMVTEEQVFYTTHRIHGEGMTELEEKNILQYPLKDKMRSGKSHALLDIKKEVLE